MTDMELIELFITLRKPTINTLVQSLAFGEGVRESFSAELEEFYDVLIQSIEYGDLSLFDDLMDRWISARTESEITAQGSSLTIILGRMLMLSMQVARQQFSDGDAFEITEALVPIYGYLTEYVTRQETGIYIEYISDELRDAQKRLERLDKTKSEFISVAAHELKTPLTLIDGYSMMLRETLDGGQENISQLLEGIEHGTHRLHEIIEDLIDVTLIDNDLLVLNFQPVWIQHILNILEREISFSAKERNIDLVFTPFSGTDEVIYGDGERLYQAINNVLFNAIKYTPNGGKVTVDGRKLPGFLEIIVADTGIGLAPENQEKIFQKFGHTGNVSLHSSGKTKYKGGGPGLGLPITKGIIEAHGGSIWVESEGFDEVKFPGSTFHILLPLSKEPPNARIARFLDLNQDQVEKVADN